MADFDPFSAGATPVSNVRKSPNLGSTSGGTDAQSSPQPVSFDPFSAGATPVEAQLQSSFDPFDNGRNRASLTTAEDIHAREASDPKFVPNNEELNTVYQDEQNKSLGQQALDSVKGMGNTVSSVVKNAVGVPGEQASAIADAVTGQPVYVKGFQPSFTEKLAAHGAPILDYLGRETSTIEDIISQAAAGTVKFGYKLAKGLARIDPTLSPPPKGPQAFNEWKQDYLQKLAMRDMSDSEAFQTAPSGQGGLGMNEAFAPFPKTAATGSLALQLAASKLPVGEVAGAGIAGTGNGMAKAAIENAATPAVKSSSLVNTIANAVEKAGGLVNKIGSLPRRVLQSVATAIAGPEFGDKVAATAQGYALHTPVGAAAATLEAAGAGAQTAGQIAKAVSETSTAGPFGTLVNLAKNPNAPDWLRSVASMPVVKTLYNIAATTATTAKGVTTSAAKGALLGAGYGVVSGDSPEELGSDIATFAGFGALHGIDANKIQLLQRRQAGVMQLVSDNLKNGVAPETLAKVPDSAMLAAADIPFLGIKDAQGRDLQVRFVNNAEMDTQQPGSDGYYNKASHTIVLNADHLADNPGAAWTSIFHELVHPLEKSSIANQPELRAQVDKAVADQGRTLMQAKTAYITNLLNPALDAEGVTDPAIREQRVNDRVSQNDADSLAETGDADNWVRSEILADAGRQALGTKAMLTPEGSIASALKPTVAKTLQGVLENMGIRFKPSSPVAQTVIPGFGDVVADPSLRRAVFNLLKTQRDFVPGKTEAAEQGAPLAPSDMGGPKAPFINLPGGRKGNKYSEVVPDGKGGEKTVMRNPGQIRKAERVEAAAMKRHVPPGTSVDKLPQAFYDDPNIGEWTKQAARQIEQATGSGTSLEGWYHGLNKSGDANWKGSVKKMLGNVLASRQDFYPMPKGFHTSKAGNSLIDIFSNLGFNRKAQLWMNRKGPLSLERWNGDISQFKNDVNLYNRNHAAGLPGEANNIGPEKRDTINAFLFGRNAKFEANNPLRKLLRNKEDRQGVVRSLRLDRLETLEPGQSDVTRPDYQKGVQNFSPAAKIAAMTPEEFAAKKWDEGDSRAAAIKLGGNLDPSKPEQLAELKQYEQQAKADMDKIQKSLDPASFAARARAGAKKQFFTEALRAAQHNGGDRIINSVLGEGHKAPFPPSGVQASPAATELENTVGDEKIPVIHLSSSSALKTVDPKFFGRGRSNAQDRRGNPKAYFFVKGSPLEQDVNVFGQGGYAAHAGEVDGNKIYDLRQGHKDPLGYYTEPNREIADDKLQEAGYHGVLVGTEDGRQIVMMFKPVKVKPAGPFKGNTAQFSPQPLSNDDEITSWMNPDGERFRVQNGHDNFAAEYLNTKNNENPSWTKVNGLSARGELKKMGWLRVVDNGHTGLMSDGVAREPNSKQKAALVDLAINKNKLAAVHESGGKMKTLYSNPDALRGMNYSPAANDDVRGVADEYLKSAGIAAIPHTDYAPLNEKLGKKVADFYQAAKHDPENPEVKASYDALAKESAAQWNAPEAAGMKFEPWTGKGQPYKNSAEMAADVRDNKHLYYFPTEKGFGTSNVSEHPMLKPSGIQVDGKDIPVNDVFRAVHDYFGHAKEGYEFGPRGEYNAYLAHSRMFSDEARPAMAAETMGQNSWVNFGPHLRNETGAIAAKGEKGYVALPDRPFAEQKATVLPADLVKESSGVRQTQFTPAPETQEDRIAKSIFGLPYGKLFPGQKQDVDANISKSAGRAITSQETSEAFKKWFGDWEDPKAFSSRRSLDKPPVSVVVAPVTGTGRPRKPLVLYHGTTADFDTFETGKDTFNSMGFFGNFQTQRHAIFASPDSTIANSFAYIKGDPENFKGARVMPVYMNLKSPLDLRNGILPHVEDELSEQGIGRSWLVNNHHTWELFDGKEGKSFVDALKKIGYDGAIFTEDSPGGNPVDTYAAFEPNQIKSASGNKGTFDSDNPSIQASPAALPDEKVKRYASRIVALTEAGGGATFNVAGGRSVNNKNFGVSIYPDRSVILAPQDVTQQRVQQFIKDNHDLLANPENNVGTRLDKSSGKVCLDVSLGIKDRKLAEYAGFKYNQKAIWDSENGKEIPTGGTGEATEHLPPAPERYDLLKQEFELQNPPSGQKQQPEKK